MKTEKKKMNTYVKYIGTLLLCAAVGGIFGAWSPTLVETGLAGGVQWLVDMICRHQLPIMLILAAAELVILEYILFQMKKTGKQLSGAEDEECDLLEYEIEKNGSIGVIVSNVLVVLFLLIVSTGYSIEYMNSLKGNARTEYLAALGFFMFGSFYNGIWQVRYVKAVQKIYPDKKGDPTSMKFRKQWLESCDEAEKEVIYQSSYQTYLIIMKIIPVLLLISMLGHLIWNTGIMAILMVGIIWIGISITYCSSCVIKKGRKLNKE